MRGYGQFCPIAKAAEVFAERWTPLIMRELLLGSHRFSEIEAGVPRIPRSLLVQRLRALERAGLIERRGDPGGRRAEYHPTQAGLELYPVLEQLGAWGQRWYNPDVGPEDIDPSLLMWDMRRRINVELLPARRIVIQFDFEGARRQSFWLVLDRHDSSVCLQDPGFDVDLVVTADALALHRVWIGRLALADAIRDNLVQLHGPSALTRAFPRWLKLSVFAPIPSAVPAG
jgi:DNA-binding HxlR family transcriptional regulator